MVKAPNNTVKQGQLKMIDFVNVVKSKADVTNR